MGGRWFKSADTNVTKCVTLRSRACRSELELAGAIQRSFVCEEQRIGVEGYWDRLHTLFYEGWTRLIQVDIREKRRGRIFTWVLGHVLAKQEFEASLIWLKCYG